MATNTDILFGRFSGQSKLKQGNRFINLTADANDGSPVSELAPMRAVMELEGSFGIVRGRLDDNTLYETRVEEVIPPILSATLDRLIKDDAVDSEAMLPVVESAIRSLIGSSAEPASEGKLLCAVVVGHRESAQGASSKDGSVTEFDFNSEVAAEIKKRVKKARVEVVFRENSTSGRRKLPAKINRMAPHIVVSLHCNAFNGSATGTETLYFHSSEKGKKLAGIVQRHLLDALELRDRKTKPKKEGDRGGHLLRFTQAPCVICEPFFVDNDSDLAVASRRKIGLANAYAAAIDEAAQELAG
jgi:N-acetylmuramoyl-L-alanine amidase